MRITISDDDFTTLQNILKTRNKALFLKLEEQKENYYKSITDKKRKSTLKANKFKEYKSKLLLEKTINIMRLENKKININSISRESGLAYNTVKKYFKDKA